MIDLAVVSAKNRSEADSLDRLRRLVEALDIFEIRNAVCHPNRQYPECYWHRMAALATDPCVEILRLRRVSDAFRCAVEGRLTPPPEGWLQQRAWCVPNNLPSVFDHQVTGLIGRQDEARELRRRLENLRNSLVAIIGPGGTGKTALCLDVLNVCVSDPTACSWVDQIVYVTAKTEVLTAKGVESILDPVASLDLVRQSVGTALYSYEEPLTDVSTNDHAGAFDQAVADMRSRRILLCIDNLETLLRDHSQEFDDFVQTLPREWRLIVTSRVTVNGANVLALGPIRREGAVKLARDYISLRGAGRMDEPKLTQLVELCDRNPLAIRLAIDSFAAGTELIRALAQTRERITEFSYTSLIDHLPSNASKVLECLFGSNEPISRGQIGHLLTLSPDEVAEAVNSLLRTSLVTRDVSGMSECYALSSSVRDLLLKAPRDQRVREEVYAQLREQQRIATEHRHAASLDPLNETFIPVDCPTHIRIAVLRARSSMLGKSPRLNQIRDLTEIRRALEFDPTSQVLRRAEAFILLQLGDRYGAIEAFEKATSCAATDPASNLRLAEVLREDQRLEEAIEQTQPLLSSGLLIAPEACVRNRMRLFRAHWVSILWLKKFQEVLKETDNWRLQGDLRPAYAALRVAGLQRYIDDGNVERPQIDWAMVEMLECAGEAFVIDGYLADVVYETFHGLERIQRLLSRQRLSEDTIRKCARFVDAHLPAMCAISAEYSLSGDFVLNFLRSLRSADADPSSPLKSPRWTDLIFMGQLDDEPLSSVGYEEARVSNVACSPRGYLFARTSDGTRDFFVRQSVTDLTQAQFRSLRLGQLLQILPDEHPPVSGRAWAAKHAMIG